jgi:Mg-chelatase subunit ChlI
MALALILTTVSPEVGGVLVRGEKGTAKTTMVRALADVMPSISVVEGCRFSCDPLDPDPTALLVLMIILYRGLAQPGWSSSRSEPRKIG